MVITQERRAEERALLSGGDALGRAADLHARATRRCSRAGPRPATQLGPLVEQAAGAGRRLPRAAQGAQPARRAGLRCRRGGVRHRRGRARARNRAARAQRRASADRGVHDPRERRGGAGARRRRTRRRCTACTASRRRRSSSGCTATLHALGIDAHFPKTVTTRDLQAITRRVSDAGRARLHRVAGRARHAAGGLSADQHRPLRPGADALRALHLADPALSGPGGASHAQGADRRQGRRGACATSRPSWARWARAPRGWRSAPTRPIATSSTFLKCTYLRERIGQTFQGLITTVVEFGCFVQILDVAVDGLLHLDNLRDDEYVMEDDGHAWRGRRSGRRLRTGAHVRVHRDRGESDRGPHRPGRWSRRTLSERAARSRPRPSTACTRYACMLERHPERVLAVQLAERREDPRARAIEELARRQQAAGAARRCPGTAGSGWATSPTRAWWPRSPRCRRGPRTTCWRPSPLRRRRCCWRSTACRIRTISAPACAPRMPAARWRWSCRATARRSSTPTVRKVAVGAAETTPVVAVTNLVRTLKLLKEAGLWMVGADADGAQAGCAGRSDGRRRAGAGRAKGRACAI